MRIFQAAGVDTPSRDWTIDDFFSVARTMRDGATGSFLPYFWNNRLWGSYAASSGWRPYSTCAAHPEKSSDTTCHRDHIHISLSWAGAAGRTSFWTGSVAAVAVNGCVAPAVVTLAWSWMS